MRWGLALRSTPRRRHCPSWPTSSVSLPMHSCRHSRPAPSTNIQLEARIFWRPRAYNTRADALAARGRDGYPQVHWFAPLASSSPGPCLTLFGAFDGSASPMAAAAGAGWWLAIGEYPRWDFGHHNRACVHEGAAHLTSPGTTCNAAEFTGLRNLLVALNTFVLHLGQ